MAMYDWNGNGKNDMGDNFIEYNIYKDVTGQNNKTSYTPSRSNGISNFGAGVSVIGGLFLQALLYSMLGINVENVPVPVIIILWAVGTTIIGTLIEKLES